MARRTFGLSGIHAVAVASAALVLGACAAAGDEGGGGRRGGSGSGSAGSSGAGGAGSGGSGAEGGFGNAGGMGAMEPPKPVNTVIDMGEECAAAAETAKNEIRPVDIIWAIDGSPSMAFVADAMEMQMNTLVTTVTGAGIQVHIIIISGLWKEDLIFNNPIVGDAIICIAPPVGSGDCANDSKLPTYHHVTTGCGGECWVGSHNALARIIQAHPDYMSSLQPNSIKYFGAVTDDTAGDTLDYKSQADKFIADAATIGAGTPGVDWKFFGIINASTGGAYQMLADQTMGTTGMVGAGQDYSALFNMLAQTVTTTSQLTCEWAIPPIPEEAGQFNKFKVNVTYSPGTGGAPMQFGKLEAGDCEMAPEGGWHYDDENAPTKVLVCPKTCDVLKSDLTGRVDVLFGCDTVKAPL